MAMSYYGYEYTRHCYVPAASQSPAPAFTPRCPGPATVPCVSCSPCAPTSAQLCPVKKTPRPGCVETRVVEGHHHHSSSSSCGGSRCPQPCSVPFPQPLAQGTGLCGPRCAQAVLRGCPQACAPAPGCLESSWPYSYQWCNSFQYNCGQ